MGFQKSHKARRKQLECLATKPKWEGGSYIRSIYSLISTLELLGHWWLLCAIHWDGWPHGLVKAPTSSFCKLPYVYILTRVFQLGVGGGGGGGYSGSPVLVLEITRSSQYCPHGQHCHGRHIQKGLVHNMTCMFLPQLPGRPAVA